MDEPMAERLVNCVKLHAELPGLAAPPFAGALGERIFEHVSQQAYALWPQQATILMNHHGLTMANPEHRRFLMKQMEAFFFDDTEGGGVTLPKEVTE
jgi:Fe-S cluster biosynthesis and repair protein YggX